MIFVSDSGVCADHDNPDLLGKAPCIPSIWTGLIALLAYL